MLTHYRYQAGYLLTPLPSRLESSSQGTLQDTLTTYHRLASRYTSSSFANPLPFLELVYTSLIKLRALDYSFILTASTDGHRWETEKAEWLHCMYFPQLNAA